MTWIIDVSINYSSVWSKHVLNDHWLSGWCLSEQTLLVANDRPVFSGHSRPIRGRGCDLWANQRPCRHRELSLPGSGYHLMSPRLVMGVILKLILFTMYAPEQRAVLEFLLKFFSIFKLYVLPWPPMTFLWAWPYYCHWSVFKLFWLCPDVLSLVQSDHMTWILASHWLWPDVLSARWMTSELGGACLTVSSLVLWRLIELWLNLPTIINNQGGSAPGVNSWEEK